MAKSKDSGAGELISISDAARLRGVSHAAIQDLIDRGKLGFEVVAGRRLLRRGEVEGFKPAPVGRPKAQATKKGGRGAGGR